jgi:hypothetical protein
MAKQLTGGGQKRLALESKEKASRYACWLFPRFPKHVYNRVTFWERRGHTTVTVPLQFHFQCMRQSELLAEPSMKR